MFKAKRLGNRRAHKRAKSRRHQQNRFQKFARAAARGAGSSTAFGLALLAIVVWAIVGPIFGFSDTWQLIINTATTILTFLMVFLIQNTQNRDSEAMHIKLDELLRATQGCHNAVMDIEELSEEELDRLKSEYALLAKRAIEDVRGGKSDLGAPDVHAKSTSRRQRPSDPKEASPA